MSALDEMYPNRWALALIQVKCRGKEPTQGDWNGKALARWHNGLDREVHLHRVADWIASGSNIGLALPTGVLVLDADTPEAAAGVDRILPDAPMQRTARGAHYLVRVPENANIKARVSVEIAEGVTIDARVGGKSQIVVAPSLHASGAEYEWRRELPPDMADLPQCPAWILEKIAEPPKRERTPGARGSRIPEGERNAALTSIAGRLRRDGLDASEMEAALQEVNVNRCDPPLPEPEVAGIANSIARYERGETKGEEKGEEKSEEKSSTAGPYAIESGRIVHRRQTREGPVSVPLCNFAARIVHEELRDDGAEQEFQLCIGGRLATGEVLPKVGVPAQGFAGMSWVTPAWGTRAVVNAGQGARDHLRAAIQTLSENVERRTVYAHLGWRTIGDTAAYLHAGGAIGAEGPVPGVEVDVPDALGPAQLPDPPDGDALREPVRSSLSLLDVAPDPVTMPLHAAVLRAVLDPAPDFALHLAGPTGAGKSELAALAQQHFGAGFDARRLPGSWTSTANSLEGLAFAAKDALLVVDDFAPRGGSAEVARFHRDADRLLRAQGNRSGRGRMRADGSLRPTKPPRGLILSTGEDVPQGQSVRARMLILELAPDALDFEKLTDLQIAARHGKLAAGMSAFLRWVAPNREALRDELLEHVARWRQRSLPHRRTPDLLGSLAGAHTIWRRFAVESGAITAAVALALEQRVGTALLAAGEAQADLQDTEEPVSRFLSLLAGALVGGDCHVADAADPEAPPAQAGRWGWRKVAGSFEPKGRRIGWLRSEGANEAREPTDLFLDPEAAFRIAQNLASGQLAPLAVTSRTLWKRLAEKHLLVSADSGRRTIKAPLGDGSRPRVLHLSPSALHLGHPSLPTTGARGATGAERALDARHGAAPPDSAPVGYPGQAGAEHASGAGNGNADARDNSAVGTAPAAPLAPVGEVGGSTPQSTSSPGESVLGESGANRGRKPVPVAVGSSLWHELEALAGRLEQEGLDRDEAEYQAREQLGLLVGASERL